MKVAISTSFFAEGDMDIDAGHAMNPRLRATNRDRISVLFGS